jgi:hypothetical protein
MAALAALHQQSTAALILHTDERRFNAAQLHDKPEYHSHGNPVCTAGNMSVIYAKPRRARRRRQRHHRRCD